MCCTSTGTPRSRRRLRLPARDRRAPARVERRIARAIRCRVRGIELGHPRRQRGGDARDVARIGLDVRVALRMHVAFGAIETRRPLDRRDERRRLEIPRLARLHLAVAGLLQHERQPADLELRAGRDDEVRLPRAGDQARLRFDVVRVLQRVGRRVDAHVVAAELLRERAPFGNRREYRQRREAPASVSASAAKAATALMNACMIEVLRRQNLCAPCAPSVRMYWRNHSLSVTSGRRSLRAYCSRKRLNSDGVQSTMNV